VIDLSNLLPCPYCGGSARFGHANWTCIEKIECVNFGQWIDGVWHRELGCAKRPSVYGKGETEEERTLSAIAQWQALQDTFSEAQDSILNLKLHEA